MPWLCWINHEKWYNLMEADWLAMLFLSQGLETFLRINGRVSISTEPDLLASLREGQKVPKTAILVSVEQVLFHCGKTINRAHLWDQGLHVDRASVPSIGQMQTALTGGSSAEAEAVDAHYHRVVRSDLYQIASTTMVLIGGNVGSIPCGSTV